MSLVTSGLVSWTNVLNGVWAAPILSKIVRRMAQPLTVFRQFTTLENDIGARMGSKFLYNVVGDVRTPGRRMGEFDRTPTTTIPFSQDFMEPFQIGNSIEGTWWSDLFSQLDVRHTFIRALMDDYVRTVDLEVANEFLKAKYVYTPTGGNANKDFVLSTTGAPLDVATRPMSLWDIRNLRGLMSHDLRIPPFDGVNHFCVTPYQGHRNIREDSEVIESLRYNQDMYFSGEVDYIEGFRFIQENHALNARLPSNNTQMVFFGADAVAEAVIYPFEIQAKVDPDYGDRYGIRYVEVLALKKKHDLAATNSERIVVVDSLPA